MQFEIKKEDIKYIDIIGNNIHIEFNYYTSMDLHYGDSSILECILRDMINNLDLIETDRKNQYIVKK